MEEPDGQSFRKRSGWIIVIILTWAAFCLGGTVYYSVIKQKEYRKRALETAWRQGKIPALRGTIYASDGSVLASSKLEFFLFWKNEKVKDAAETAFGRALFNGAEISEKEMSLLQPLFRQYPSSIWVETRERRKTAPGAEPFEQKYNEVLSGQEGLFVVMHDRYGRQVPGSLKIIRQQKPGRSVTLSPGEEADK